MSDGDDFADYGENGDGEDTLAPKKAAAQQNYGPIIEHIFAKHHTEGALEVPFHRDEIVTVQPLEPRFQGSRVVGRGRELGHGHQ